MSESPTPTYRLICPERCQEQLKQWARKANRLKMGEAFAEVTEYIYGKLTTEPVSWGDPQYYLREMGVLVCHGTHPMLHVYFGVDEIRKLVYVKDFCLMPNHPLAQEE